MNNPKLSIIMSVYNADQYLKIAIDSILKQSFSNFEFIIIDDCSDDYSYEIIRDYSFQDSRIQYFRNEQNMGLTYSLNYGLNFANGTFIARMDADDISIANRFKEQIDYLDSHPDVGIIGTAYRVIDQKGIVLEKYFQPTDDIYIRWQMLFHNAFCHSSIMFRKEILENQKLKYGPYKYAQDYDLASRILRTWKGANLEDILIEWRRSPQQISNSKLLQQINCADDISLRNVSDLMDNSSITLEQIHLLRKYYYRSVSYLGIDPIVINKWIDIHDSFRHKYNDKKVRSISKWLTRKIFLLVDGVLIKRDFVKIINRCYKMDKFETIKGILKRNIKNLK